MKPKKQTDLIFIIILSILCVLLSIDSFCQTQPPQPALLPPPITHDTITFHDTDVPVELMYFEGRRSFDEYGNGGFVQLEWETASEYNNDHFTIEISDDSKEWTTILNASGHGTSKIKSNYSFQIYMPERLYYRLSQVDYDNTTKIIGIIVIAEWDKKYNAQYFDHQGRELPPEYKGLKLIYIDGKYYRTEFQR